VLIIRTQHLIRLVLLISTLGIDDLRTRLLTNHERKLIQKYLEANGDRTPTVRSIARYARQIDLQEVYKDIELIKGFKAAYAKRNGG
jgi:hypothetical protein